MFKLPEVQGEYKFNESLAKYSFFRTGGCVDVLFIPLSQSDLINFLKNVDKNIPIFVIGAGSNLLIRDGRIKGVVINLQKLNKVEFNNFKIVAECGATSSKIFNLAKINNIAGFEFLGLIPGTIGGACKMNAGCYGSCVANILESIKTVNFDGNVKIFSTRDCKMEYRKNNLPDNLIFLETTFNCEEVKSSEEIQKTYDEMLAKKIATQPIKEKTCGSTFKNFQDIPAWKIIQELGFQGVDFNGVKISEKHANFLVNHSSMSSTNIENLIKLIQKKAKEEKNMELELEIQILG